MKYVKRTRNTLSFGKAYPSHLQSVIGRKQFTYPLGSVEQTEAEVTLQCSKAMQVYDLRVKQATNSSPDAFNSAEVDALVDAKLKAIMKDRGALADFKVAKHIMDFYEQDKTADGSPTIAAEQAVLTAAQAASELVPQIEDVIWKEQTGQELTITDKVNGATWLALQIKADSKPKHLRNLWDSYMEYRGIDQTSKRGIHLRKRWDLFISIIGDRTLASAMASPLEHQTLSLELNAAIRKFRDMRLLTVTGSTTSRELTDIKACLMHSSNENDFDWHLARTKISKQQAGVVKVKQPLTQEHQRLLVAHVTSPEHRHEPTSTMALLYLQGGISFSEVDRFDLEKQLTYLETEDTPYVSIEGLTKTEARKRVVPIVIGINVIREGLENTIKWLKETPQATVLRHMTNMLKAATGSNEYSSHSLRHGFSLNCALNPNVRDVDKINIGGWSSAAGSVSRISMRYGAAALGGTEQLVSLHQASREIHKHLL